MRHTPRSEQEAPAPSRSVFPPGEYDAVVKKAEEQQSNAGNEMMKLVLTCHGPKGTTDVFDYLVSTETWAWKLRHFCESAGIDYYSGDLEPYDCEGRNVRVKLSIEKRQGYPDKNKVEDYLPRSNGAQVKTAPAAVAADPDIPFSVALRP